MTSKQRVFSHSGDINYNDYIKNKIGVETFKNIKSSQHQNNVNNNIIKKFKNHSDLINFTKTYYNYYNLNNYSLRPTKDLYNSNISIVDNKVLREFNDGVDVDNKCQNYFNECLELSQVLYPYALYSSNTPKIHMHFNLDLNKWCTKKTIVDYNSIYNLDNTNINIDGYNVCNSDNGNCYKIGNKVNNSDDNNSGGHDANDCECKKTKCKTGLCKNAKPLFIHL